MVTVGPQLYGLKHITVGCHRSIRNDELHTKAEYIVAHGIASYINDRKAVIGSWHFVFEDEGAIIPPEYRERFDSLPNEYSHLYFAKEGKLCACILIEDPMREEVSEVIGKLKDQGFRHIGMMTGDSERTAAAIAQKAGIDEYYSEILP